MFFPKVAKKIFSIFDLCLCSNNETKNFLIKLNIQNVYFKGNLKLANKIDEEKIKDVNKDYLQKKRFWFAANTHKGEEIFCLKTHLEVKKKFKIY